MSADTRASASGNPVTDNLDIWSGVYVKKATTGRGRSGKISPYGIQKLRELILELAVRGKLVPQDSNDEPANVLLEKIAKERANLLKEGKIKKQKTISSITEREQQFRLPIGWAKERFGNLAIIERGGSPRPIKSFLTDDPDGLNWIKIGDADIGGKHISSTAEKIIKEGLPKTRMVYPGDFLLTNSMSFGRPYITKIEGCIHDGWLRISPATLIDKNYLYWLLTSPFVKKSLTDLAAGAVVQNLNSDKVRGVVILVPPLAEQHRIVAKVDELMTLCDRLEQQQTDSIAAHQTLVETLLGVLTTATDQKDFAQTWQRIAENFDTLFTTEHSINQLKQTILQLAVMGKLVHQNPNDESVSMLLGKIEGEKERLVKEGKTKKQKPLSEITVGQFTQVLPKNWRWVHLGKLVTVMDAGWSPACLPHPSPSNNVWGVLKTTAVQIMRYLGEENKELPVNKNPKPQYEVKRGDILITRAGPKNRVAISCLVEATRPKLMISDKIIRFHLVDMGIYERYISLCLNVGATAEYLDNAKSGMVASQMNISQDKLRLAPIPLCPIAEQKKIVAKVDELMALCDTLKTRLQDAQTTQTQLADAIVEQAVA